MTKFNILKSRELYEKFEGDTKKIAEFLGLEPRDVFTWKGCVFHRH